MDCCYTHSRSYKMSTNNGIHSCPEGFAAILYLPCIPCLCRCKAIETYKSHLSPQAVLCPKHHFHDHFLTWNIIPPDPPRPTSISAVPLPPWQCRCRFNCQKTNRTDWNECDDEDGWCDHKRKQISLDWLRLSRSRTLNLFYSADHSGVLALHRGFVINGTNTEFYFCYYWMKHLRI